jgi:hypothetical protein
MMGCVPVTKPAVSPNGNYLIMSLGDSYAAGWSADAANGGNGYRAYLINNIIGPNEVHNVTAVGSQLSGTANLRHEGHPGFTTSQVIAGVQSGWLDNPAPANAGPPQFVIITTGSNDFGAGATWQQVLADVSTLVDLVLAVPTAPCVVLTEQILHSGSISHVLTDNTRRQQAYNAALPGMVATKPAGRVAIAHTSRIRQQNLDSGGVHLSNLGYQQMEWEIYQALAPWLGWDDGAGRQWMVNRPCPYDSRPA